MDEMRLNQDTVLKLSIICAYPALCVLFMGLDLGMFWGFKGSFIALIGFGIGFWVFSEFASEHPSLLSKLGYVLLQVAPWGVMLAAASAVIYSEGKEIGMSLANQSELILWGLIAVGAIAPIFIRSQLGKFGITRKRLETDQVLLAIVWIAYALSAAILSSIFLTGLFNPTSYLDYLLLVPYAVVFGLFGPETLRGNGPVLMGGYLVGWTLIGDRHAVLGLPPIDGGILIGSGIVWYSLFASRCALDVDRIREARTERALFTIRHAQLTGLVESAPNSFRVEKQNRINRPTVYRLLFFRDRLLFFRVPGSTEISERRAIARKKGGVDHTVPKTPRNLSEVSNEELIRIDKKNFELPYENISRIEMKEPITRLEESLRAGVLHLEGVEKLRFSISPDQSFRECVEIARRFFPTGEYRYDRGQKPRSSEKASSRSP